MTTRRSALPQGISVVFHREDWHFEARWNDRVKVGWAVCLPEGTSLKIADLVVHDEVSIPWPIAHRLLIGLGVPCRKRSFRGCGIGTVLLDRIVTEASPAGMTRVWGSVTASDIEKSPHLLDWYRDRGFEVSYEFSDPDIKAVATISRSVSNAEPGG
jgi:GNAT superfamily N-acetyltransferase